MNNQPSLSKFIKLLLYTLTKWLGQEKANRDAIAKTTVRVSLKSTRQQRQMNINLQFGHGNYCYHNSQKSPSFAPVKFKESKVSGGTLKDGMRNNNNNNNKLRWDFIDDFIEPAKKALEFTRVLNELKPSNQYYSYHYSPYAISHHQYPQYRLHLSSPMNFSSAG